MWPPGVQRLMEEGGYNIKAEICQRLWRSVLTLQIRSTGDGQLPNIRGEGIMGSRKAAIANLDAAIGLTEPVGQVFPGVLRSRAGGVDL